VSADARIRKTTRGGSTFGAHSSGIPHHAVIERAETQGDDVERVVLVQPPRPFRALLRHFRDRALHVAGGEIQRRQFGDGGIDIVRHALPVAVPVHVVDQAADIFAGQVAFQRPRRVGVAEGGGHVGHIRIHHALVVQRAGEIDRAAIDADLKAAEHLQIEPGRGDDDVGLEFAAVLEPDAPRREGVDLVGHHRGATTLDGAKQVAVGHQA
jgi:hypothetical protein